jgi:hypothetical protein
MQNPTGSSEPRPRTRRFAKRSEPKKPLNDPHKIHFATLAEKPAE